MKNQHSYSTLFLTLFVFFVLLSNLGCKKFIEIQAPDNSLNRDNVFLNDATAAAVLTQQYVEIGSTSISDGGLTSMSFYPGLSSDEFDLFDESQDPYKFYFTNNLTSIIHNGNQFWNRLYNHIYVANTAIEGIEISAGLSPTVKKQLLGEAKFLRAFCYFYLVNLYGDVPLALTTDYKLNALLPRTSSVQIYNQIVNDLKAATGLLTSTYSSADAKSFGAHIERVRPNLWTAKALLARVYLYQKDYPNAETEASDVIGQSNLYTLGILNSVFLKNSSEAIWQIQPTFSTDANTMEGSFFILPDGGPDNSHPVSLRKVFMDSFVKGDNRSIEWTNSVVIAGKAYYYPYKYKLGFNNPELQEYTMVLRLAEQYLIRAEARLNQGKISGTIQDINLLRERARGADSGDLPALPAGITSQQASDALVYERRSELFAEWGHRWLDLKRWGTATKVLLPIKGQNFEPFDELYPIPQNEIDKNPSLKGFQNPGY